MVAHASSLLQNYMDITVVEMPKRVRFRLQVLLHQETAHQVDLESEVLVVGQSAQTWKGSAQGGPLVFGDALVVL